jgi:hypothetical protein
VNDGGTGERKRGMRENTTAVNFLFLFFFFRTTCREGPIIFYKQN